MESQISEMRGSGVGAAQSTETQPPNLSRLHFFAEDVWSDAIRSHQATEARQQV